MTPIFFFFFVLTHTTPIYTFSGDTSYINGSGIITSSGISSLGNHKITTKIIIGNGITEISDSSFQPCYNLRRVFISQTITKISGSSFYSNYQLEFIEVDSSNTHFVNDSFGALLSFNQKFLYKVPTILTHYDVPQRVECFIGMTFQGSTFDNFIVSRYVDYIGYACFHLFKCNTFKFESNSYFTRLNESFFRYSTINTIIFPSSLEEISVEKYPAFTSASINVIRFESPSKLTKISGVFLESSNIKSIELPSTLTEINKEFLKNCKGIENLTIPRDCCSISSTAIINCPMLSSIFVEEGNPFFKSNNGVLTDVDETQLVFIPPSITMVNIGSNIDDISADTIRQCNKLRELNISSDNPKYSSLNGLLLNKAKTVLIAICGGVDKVVVPSTVESFENQTAIGCANLVEFSFNETNVTSIPEECFKECTNLLSVELPNTLTKVMPSAFYGCLSLKSFVFSIKSLHRLDDFSFYNSGLTSAILKNHFEYIGSRALAACKSLVEVEIDLSENSILGTYALYQSSITKVTIGPNLRSLY